MEREQQWRLELDSAICDAHGICALCCSERIGLDEWGYAVVSADPILDDRLLKRARRAVLACPEGALTLRSARDNVSFRHESTSRLPMTAARPKARETN